MKKLINYTFCALMVFMAIWLTASCIDLVTDIGLEGEKTMEWWNFFRIFP